LALVGNQEPRIDLVPDGDEHPAWDEITDFLASLDIKLDPWQEHVLWASLLRRKKIWAAFVVGVCASRQNGKNGILEARELAGACVLKEKLQIHSAHLADTSMEGFRRLDDIIDAHPELSKDVTNIRRQNGHEQITFRGGQRIRFRTRTRGGGRGFSGSPVYFDESMYLPEMNYGAMLPVISAQPDPQVWHTGSAVDQQIMDEGLVFSRVRSRALAGEDRLAYFEWSLDVQTPDEVTPEQATDPAVWAQTTPALGIRITPEYLRAEQRALDARTFAVERLCAGDWPSADGLRTVIDLELWRKLTDTASVPVGSVVYAFDVRPDRSSSVIAAIGRRADGTFHVEVGEQRSGAGWLLDTLQELERKHLPVGIVCDGVGPAASLVPELLKRNVTIRALTTPEMGEACAMFYDAVAEERLHHLGQPELEQAIKGAEQRLLGDRWAWSRRNSISNISPLVAVTLGVWMLTTSEQVEPLFAFG